MAEGPEFKALLKRHRLAAGLTQEALAELADLSARAVQDLERGVNRSPRQDTLDRLAQVLALAPADRAALEASVSRRRGPRVPDAGPRHALPVPLTACIGREQEVAQARALLLEHGARLLTLTGPGGVGKTRLGVEIARECAGAFADGAAFIALDALRDPLAVAPALLRAFGLAELAAQSSLETLIEALRRRRVLLLLDNFEHLRASTPMLVDLLTSCSGLAATVTSRTPLRVPGEHRLAVSTLPVPHRIPHLGGVWRPSPQPERIGQSPAVRLFVERARAVLPAFALTPGNAETVSAICRRLDGLPLAIELAAARLNVLTPEMLLDRLGERLRLLGDGLGGRPGRHRTLRDTVAWSYDLLSVGEMALFRRLAVFDGGCTLEAAEAVCALPGQGAAEVLDGLDALVDSSLLHRAAGVAGAYRFTMLETVRDYAREFAQGQDETALLERGHAAFYLRIAELAEPGLRGRALGDWVARLDEEYGNIAAALRWAHAQQEAAIAARLVAAAWRYWYERGYLREAREVLEATLRSGQAVPRATWAGVLHGAAAVACALGDRAAAEMQATAALAVYRETGADEYLPGVLATLGHVARLGENFERALVRYQEALGLQRGVHDNRTGIECLEGAALALGALGMPRPALLLSGAADGVRDAIGAELLPTERAARAAMLERAHAVLGEASARMVLMEGRALLPRSAAALVGEQDLSRLAGYEGA